MAHENLPGYFTNYLIANYPERLNRFNYHLSLDTTAYYYGCASGHNIQYPAIVSVKQVTNHSPGLYASQNRQGEGDHSRFPGQQLRLRHRQGLQRRWR